MWAGHPDNTAKGRPTRRVWPRQLPSTLLQCCGRSRCSPTRNRTKTSTLGSSNLSCCGGCSCYRMQGSPLRRSLCDDLLLVMCILPLADASKYRRRCKKLPLRFPQSRTWLVRQLSTSGSHKCFPTALKSVITESALSKFLNITRSGASWTRFTTTSPRTFGTFAANWLGSNRRLERRNPLPPVLASEPHGARDDIRFAAGLYSGLYRSRHQAGCVGHIPR